MQGYNGTAGKICFKIFNWILIVFCNNHGNFFAINLFHLITNILFTGDALSPHNHQQFTTKDRDNDKWPENCAERFHGAFWYNSCHNANLNGKYMMSETINKTGVVWHSWKDSHYSLKRVEMKIKPNKCH